MAKFIACDIFKGKKVNENGLWMEINVNDSNVINSISKFTLNKVFVFNSNSSNLVRLNKNVIIITDQISTFMSKYSDTPVTYIQINYVEPGNSIAFLTRLIKNIVSGCIISITYPSKHEQLWLQSKGMTVKEIGSHVNFSIMEVLNNPYCSSETYRTFNKNKSIIKVCNKRVAGYLWHYCHFLIDCLVHEYKNIIKKGETSENTIAQVVRLKGVQHSVGIFSSHYEKILPIKNIELDLNNYDNLFCETRIVTAPSHIINRTDSAGNNVGPYSMGYFDDIYAYAEEKFHLKNDPKKYPRIILIERGFQNLIYSKHDSGKARRYIKNHNDLKKFLADKYKDDFINLVLEHVDIIDQIKYFYNAKVVIGQHGAGLSNVIWMQPGTHIIEIAPILVKIFKYLTVCKKVNYNSFTRAVVDIAYIENLLNKYL